MLLESGLVNFAFFFFFKVNCKQINLEALFCSSRTGLCHQTSRPTPLCSRPCPTSWALFQYFLLHFYFLIALGGGEARRAEVTGLRSCQKKPPLPAFHDSTSYKHCFPVFKPFLCVCVSRE